MLLWKKQPQGVKIFAQNIWLGCPQRLALKLGYKILPLKIKPVKRRFRFSKFTFKKSWLENYLVLLDLNTVYFFVMALANFRPFSSPLAHPMLITARHYVFRILTQFTGNLVAKLAPQTQVSAWDLNWKPSNSKCDSFTH